MLKNNVDKHTIILQDPYGRKLSYRAGPKFVVGYTVLSKNLAKQVTRKLKSRDKSPQSAGQGVPGGFRGCQKLLRSDGEGELSTSCERRQRKRKLGGCFHLSFELEALSQIVLK